METLLGIAVVAATFAALRRLAPRSDGAPLAAIRRMPGAETTLALLLTMSLALGMGLAIDGAIALWQNGLAAGMALG